MDKEVRALYVDTIKNILIAGGNFTIAGDTVANRIAYFDGIQWHAYGYGLGKNDLTDHVDALCMYNNQLYAAGYFTTSGTSLVNNIARWNDATGVSEATESNIVFSIYPNPSKGLSTVAYTLPIGQTQAKVLLTDGKGSVIKTYSLSTTQGTLSLDNTGLAAGTYFIQLQGVGYISTKKMLVLE